MCGVAIRHLSPPKHFTSPIPQSSAKMKTTFGFSAAAAMVVQQHEASRMSTRKIIKLPLISINRRSSQVGSGFLLPGGKVTTPFSADITTTMLYLGFDQNARSGWESLSHTLYRSVGQGKKDAPLGDSDIDKLLKLTATSNTIPISETVSRVLRSRAGPSSEGISPGPAQCKDHSDFAGGPAWPVQSAPLKGNGQMMKNSCSPAPQLLGNSTREERGSSICTRLRERPKSVCVG